LSDITDSRGVEPLRAMLLTPLQTPFPVEKMTIGYKFGLFLTAFGTVIIMLLKHLIFSCFQKDSRFEITKEPEPLLFGNRSQVKINPHE
jgi:hypothetical protein